MTLLCFSLLVIESSVLLSVTGPWWNNDRVFPAIWFLSSRVCFDCPLSCRSLARKYSCCVLVGLSHMLVQTMSCFLVTLSPHLRGVHENSSWSKEEVDHIWEEVMWHWSWSKWYTASYLPNWFAVPPKLTLSETQLPGPALPPEGTQRGNTHPSVKGTCLELVKTHVSHCLWSTQVFHSEGLEVKKKKI